MSDWNQLLPSSHTDTFTRDRLPPKEQWPVFLADLPELNYPDTLNAATELVDLHVQQGRGQREVADREVPVQCDQPGGHGADWTPRRRHRKPPQARHRDASAARFAADWR